MSAFVEIQKVIVVPGMEMRVVHRARCDDHPVTEYLIPPWLSENTYIIEAGSMSWFNALLDAKIHDAEDLEKKNQRQ